MNTVDKEKELNDYIKELNDYKATQKLRRRLLNLLSKLICQWNSLCRQYTPLYV